MQISFLPVEDRLLFRFNTTDHHEFAFWFTRRYVKRLWPILLKTLEELQPPITDNSDPGARAVVRSFQHEQMISQADFSTPYRDPKKSGHSSKDFQRPLGQKPILAARINIKPAAGNSRILALHPESGQGVELSLDARLLHFFCRLLAEGLKQSDWNLPLEPATATPPPSARAIN